MKYFHLFTGMVPEQAYEMAEKARCRNGNRETETRSIGQPDGRE